MREVVVTAHAMDRYRERVSSEAKASDVILSFEQSERLSKDRTSWPVSLSQYPTKAGASYYWDHAYELMYVVEESLKTIRLITVFYPDIQQKPLEQRLAEPEPSLDELKSRVKSIATRRSRLIGESDFLNGQLKMLKGRIKKAEAASSNQI